MAATAARARDWCCGASIKSVAIVDRVERCTTGRRRQNWWEKGADSGRDQERASQRVGQSGVGADLDALRI
jgi:phosphoribosyl-AMP cyclohydrolase